MKHLFSWKSNAVALGLALVCAAAASAQSGMRVDVPFAFTAGNRVLPAGEYRVVVDATHGYSRILPADGQAVCVVQLTPGTAERDGAKAGRGVLRFEKHGSRYTLVGIWQAGSVAGNEVVKAKAKGEYAKTGAALDVGAL